MKVKSMSLTVDAIKTVLVKGRGIEERILMFREGARVHATGPSGVVLDRTFPSNSRARAFMGHTNTLSPVVN